jgi:DNA-binding CsgD family transcriptional regulator
MNGLSPRDLRLLRDALDPTVEPVPGNLISQAALQEIDRLIPAGNVVIQVMNHEDRTVSWQCTDDQPGDSDPAIRALFWSGFWDSECSYPQRTGDASIMWSGYRPPPPPTPNPAMQEFLDALGWRDEVVMPLGSYDSDDHRLLLFRRKGARFRERDVLLLEVLRPAVAELHARHLRRLSPPANLTVRQVEILRLVAQGSTNRQIARALTISEGTARTHLANIYAKLGATNRMQAIAAAGLVTMARTPQPA